MMWSLTSPNLRSFLHHAMNTTFSLRLPEIDSTTASGVARECFEIIDLLEARLSRFIAESEVSRINQLLSGETLRISDDCHACLLAAVDGQHRTQGLFDVSYRRNVTDGKLIIHPDVAAVTCVREGCQVDLGGIAKGFAVDRVAELLMDWDIPHALITAGASSIRAVGPIPWAIELHGVASRRLLSLRHQSLSASGITVQGEHIIRPPGIPALDLTTPQRCWVVSDLATEAEVFSTALMLLPLSSLLQQAIADDLKSGFFYVDTNSDVFGPCELPWLGGGNARPS